MSRHEEIREPTGSVVEGPEGPTIQIQRTLGQPPEDVWSYLADPELLRWYGTYTGDPASGSVQLAMVEAPEHPGECVIEVCERPSRLHVTLTDPQGNPWRLRVSLDRAVAGAGSATDLVFRQPLAGSKDESSEIGPGWEYYLDRLTAALNGGDVDAVDFADYYPAQKAHYSTEAGTA
ncbi:polyketide cyclase [Cellulosimicrobium funkei]|nr:polyketide cyclase [Cellulosimicrobium funkei]